MAYPLCSLPPSPSAYPTHPLNSRTPTMSRIPRSNQSINHSKISLFLSLSRAPIGFNRRAVKNRTLPFSAFICPQISLSRAPLIILSLFTIVVTANRIKKGESLALCVKTLHLPTIVCCSAATLALCLVIFFSYRDTVREKLPLGI